MSPRDRNVCVAMVVLAALAGASAARAQAGAPGSPQPACGKGTTATQDCAAKPVPAAPGVDAAKRFPFPGEETAAPKAAQPGTVPDAPSADAPPPDAPSNAAPQHRTPRTPPPAYPGDPDASKGAGKDDGFSSSSSGSPDSNGSSSTDPGAAASDDAGPLTDAGSTGDLTPKSSSRKKLKKLDPQTPEQREAEDLDVASFYMNDGNYTAAYARAKDALSLKPDDPSAHFTMAEAALKLGKPDEAREHYAKCLELDPLPKERKTAERALAEMTASRR